MKRSLLLFGLGLATALWAGWMAFPRLLYVERQQPFQFHHKAHAEKSGTTQCTDCHAIRDDGTFAGIPATENCAACHSDKLGTSKDEAVLVDSFVKTGQQTPWLIYAKQPANVWFPHAIHVRTAGIACADCHGNYGESDVPRKYELNRISGYSRDIWGHSLTRSHRAPGDGMKMSDCERCHKHRNVEVGCLGCHQ